MMLEFGGGLAILNSVVSAKKLSAEVIQDFYPFTEYPAWDPKWHLQLNTDIRSQKQGMWATPLGSLRVSRSVSVSH